MSTSSPAHPLGPDPGRSIRVWVALLLRLGIGLTLLSTGLAGYFGQKGGGGPMGGWMAPRWLLDPFLSGLSTVAIGIGMALILGFLTKASAIAAGFLGLILPLYAIVQVLAMQTIGSGVRGRFGSDEFMAILITMSLPNLLTNVAMIWLSPLENHPYSIDALIFGRNGVDPVSFPPSPRPGTAPVVRGDSPITVGE